jgi:xanthine dehydrogenase YagR molybdenum-binding subunit
MSRYLGKETTRVDGLAKVTGQAKYTAEFQIPNVSYGFIVLSTVAKGRITTIDTREAEKAGGVIRVFTHLNSGKLGPSPEPGRAPAPGATEPPPATAQWAWPLQSDRVFFSGQPVALVVAESYEQARHAARLVKVSYQTERHNTDFATVLDRAQPDPDTAKGKPRGNPVAAMQAAEITVEAEYHIPINHHNPIEPHAAIAFWQGDQLTIFDKTQNVYGVQEHLAKGLRVPAASIRVVSPFVGGAFGSSLNPNYYPSLTAMAARELKRPVKVVFTRTQMYTLHGLPAAYHPEGGAVGRSERQAVGHHPRGVPQHIFVRAVFRRDDELPEAGVCVSESQCAIEGCGNRSGHAHVDARTRCGERHVRAGKRHG